MSRSFLCVCGHPPYWHQRAHREYCKYCLNCGGEVDSSRGCCLSPKRCGCNQLDQTAPSDPADGPLTRIHNDINQSRSAGPTESRRTSD